MSTRKEKLLQKLNPKLLKITPKLSGATGSIIDLGGCENTLEDGAKKLMMRFIKNQDLWDKFKNGSVQESVEVTVSTVRCNENEEICELISERLLLPHSGLTETDHASERPGKKLQKLKMELQDKMSAKWEEEYKKRVSEIERYKSAEKGKEIGDEETDSFLDDDSGLDDDGEDGSCSSKKKKEAVSKESLENDIDADYNSEEVEEEEEEEEDEEVEEEDEEEEKQEKKKKKKKKKKETFLDDEAVEDDDNDDSSSLVPLRSDDEDSEDEIIPVEDNANDADMSGNDEENDGESSLIPAYQPGGGLLNGGSELTQADDGLPKGLFSPSLRLSVGESPNSKSPCDYFGKSKEESNSGERRNLFMERRKLFSQVQNPDEAYDLNDAFEFCSGKFPEMDEHGSIKLGTQNLVSQDTATSNEYKLTGTTQLTLEENSQSDNESKDVGEQSSEKDKQKTKRRIMTFDENEVDEGFQLDPVEEEETTTAPRVLLDDEDDDDAGNGFVPPNKRKMKSLHFSDEEDEANEGETETETKTKTGEEDENEEEEAEEEEGENSEDEVEEGDDQRSVNYDSEENEIVNPKEFFEGEAELSGSEFSGDEDERGLDELDYEAGDAENLDQDKVRSQLEKIHIRRVLDDDAREVRLIQELLFEDGDLHSDGKGRDRKFKWKNLGTFDDKPNGTESKDDQGNSSDEDCAEEEQLRKLRHEKELFLMESKNNKDSDSEGEIVDESFLKLKMTTAKESFKLSAYTETRVEIHKNGLDSSAKAKLPLSVCNARGSFLTRNEEFLSRLAKATSTASDSVTGPKNFKNFVFATKSPEKVDPDKSTVCKRQAEGGDICSRQEKKIKLIPPKIIDTGPSIFDLLV